MIITKKQLRRAIERSRCIPPSMKGYYFINISSKKRWLWETELLKAELIYMTFSDSKTHERITHGDTHNTDHAV